jgi:uncharacterized DUF497 family protein
VRFDWDIEKNERLKKERNISFEDIALLLAAGKLWKTADHPNPEKYPNQRVFLVPLDGYIFFVPFVMENETIFLKTAFPHRKATRDYLKEIKENE